MKDLKILHTTRYIPVYTYVILLRHVMLLLLWLINYIILDHEKTICLLYRRENPALQGQHISGHISIDIFYRILNILNFRINDKIVSTMRSILVVTR